jgi:hypothetical protein
MKMRCCSFGAPMIRGGNGTPLQTYVHPHQPKKAGTYFWGVSDNLCLSSSLALHFFRSFFSCTPPC